MPRPENLKRRDLSTHVPHDVLKKAVRSTQRHEKKTLAQWLEDVVAPMAIDPHEPLTCDELFEACAHHRGEALVAMLSHYPLRPATDRPLVLALKHGHTAVAMALLQPDFPRPQPLMAYQAKDLLEHPAGMALFLDPGAHEVLLALDAADVLPKTCSDEDAAPSFFQLAVTVSPSKGADCVAPLVLAGHDVDADGSSFSNRMTPLMLAAKHFNFEWAQALLDAGANPSRTRSHPLGYHALFDAAEALRLMPARDRTPLPERAVRTLQVLLEAGLSWDEPCAYDGKTPWQTARLDDWKPETQRLLRSLGVHKVLEQGTPAAKQRPAARSRL